mgnify:CR=1 FL=1
MKTIKRYDTVMVKGFQTLYEVESVKGKYAFIKELGWGLKSELIRYSWRKYCPRYQESIDGCIGFSFHECCHEYNNRCYKTIYKNWEEK